MNVWCVRVRLDDVAMFVYTSAVGPCRCFHIGGSGVC